jgi:hypothetical protein
LTHGSITEIFKRYNFENDLRAFEQKIKNPFDNTANKKLFAVFCYFLHLNMNKNDKIGT